MVQVAITNEQEHLKIDVEKLRAAVSEVCAGEGIAAGEISLAIVDNAVIHQLNRRWLEHDEPTDVLSFVLEEAEGFREGEIIVSAEMALTRAAEFCWPAESELLLYIVHGALHLVGYDDREPAARDLMRQREQFYLHRLGIQEGSGFKRVQGSGFRVQ